MSDWPKVDPLAWVWFDDPFMDVPWLADLKWTPERMAELSAEGVTYLLCEMTDGRPLGWAPLGSAKPFETGEGTHWRIRVVEGRKDTLA